MLSWYLLTPVLLAICAGYGDSLIQDMFSALWQGTLAGCNALANCVGVALTDGHSE